MSLINDMLRDLEKRRKREERGMASSETPVVVDGSTTPKFFFLAGGVLLLAVIVWLGIQISPGMLPIKPAVPTLSAQQQITPVVEQEDTATILQDDGAKSPVADAPSLEASALIPNATPAVSEPLAATLLHLGVVETKDTAQLNLTFVQLPEYRLLQNGIGMAQLVVSFSQTQIGADFVIPQLTGTLLKRVSLMPQRQTLQLLVDLDESARVESLQAVDDSGQGYRLLIKIVATAPAVENLATAESQKKPIPIPDKIPTVAAKVVEVENPAAIKVSKTRTQLSRDQQAYRAGLEQLKRGHLIDAEASFNQALLTNPKLVAARLQLAGLLQQQMQVAKAESLLQQGLAQSPKNSDLRKMYARLLLNDQRQGEAIDLLKAEPVPEIIQDLEYHALLAALFQESGQFEAASSIYAQLVQVQPQAALWWMGLAISLEQSGASERALNAYQQALSLPGLRPDLQNYIQSRLQAL
ncbi:MAG: tetratricopeptide repeat protein [Desulfuromusa sp.]|nr:tetratricopeptide repeat protein [Desulfuromusa sp.]